MCLQAAHRHCLTLKEPWKLQASSSLDRPPIGPGSVSRELRLGRDDGRSPHDEPRTLVVRDLWRRIFIDENGGGPWVVYESDTRRRLSRPGNKQRTANHKTNPTSSVRAATVAGRQPDAPLTRSVDSGGFGATLGRLIRVFRSNKGREATTEQRGVCSDEQTCLFESQFKD